MAIVRISDLPVETATPEPADYLAVDGLLGTRKVTAANMAASGRPYASEPEAVAGASAVVVMSPLRTTDHFNSRTTVTTRTLLMSASIAALKTSLSLQNVDNTTDLNKPVSTATQTALDAKAPNSRLISTANSLTGGGSLAADRTLSLVNDVASPTASQYYGTNAGGTKGWFNIPAGGIVEAENVNYFGFPVGIEAENAQDAFDYVGNGLIYPTGSLENSWMDGKNINIIKRATPKFLMPEMYIGQETQIIYCPAEDPNDYSGATDFAPAIEAMRAEALSLLGPAAWFPADFKKAPFGIAFQPGMRYAFDSGANLTNLMAKGLTIQGNGATLVGRYNDGAPLLDLIGSAGIYVNELHGESNNTAQPTVGIGIGRISPLLDAADMHFNNCRWAGWWKKACLYNSASEVSRIIGGEYMSIGLAASAVWLDARNTIGMGSFTQADDYVLAQNVAVSSISHWMYGTNIRCVSGCETGALRITSSETETDLNQVSGVNVEAYLTNVASSGGYPKAPAVYIEGPVKGFFFKSHSELTNNDTNLDLSHLVYYQRGNGTNPLIQWNHHIEDYFSDVETAVIGCNSHANPMYLEDCTIKIGHQRGGPSPGVTAKLFDTTMTNVRMSGTISVRNLPVSFMNLNALQYCDVDIFGGVAVSNIAINSGSRARVRTTVGSGGDLLNIMSVAASGAVIPDGYDIITLDGTTSSITLTPNVAQTRQFTIVSRVAGAVNVLGLSSSGGFVTLPAARSLHVVQINSQFFVDMG